MKHATEDTLGSGQNYRRKGLQVMGEGHDLLCFEKGRVAIFSAVTKGRVIIFHAIIQYRNWKILKKFSIGKYSQCNKESNSGSTDQGESDDASHHSKEIICEVSEQKSTTDSSPDENGLVLPRFTHYRLRKTYF